MIGQHLKSRGNNSGLVQVKLCQRAYTGNVPNEAMRTGNTIVSLVIASGLMLWTVGIQSIDSIGITVASRGEVEVVSQGESRPLGQGDFVAENDEIIVGDRSFTVIQFVDGAKMSLRPDSSLLVEQYRFAGGADDVATLFLRAGGMRVNLGAISSNAPKAYRIRTPSGLMMINGPEGSLTLCGEEICEQHGLEKLPD